MILALFKLKEPIGRKRLAVYLGVGEGSVRTLLNKIDDLVDSSSKGHYLNEKGKKEVEKINECLVGPKKLVSNIDSEDSSRFAIKLNDHHLEKGTKIRDEIIRGGAKGGLVLNVLGSDVFFPEDETSLNKVYPELDRELSEKFNLKRNGVLLISWGSDDQGKSCIRASLVIQDDLKDKIDQIVK